MDIWCFEADISLPARKSSRTEELSAQGWEHGPCTLCYPPVPPPPCSGAGLGCPWLASCSSLGNGLHATSLITGRDLSDSYWLDRSSQVIDISLYLTGQSPSSKAITQDLQSSQPQSSWLIYRFPLHKSSLYRLVSTCPKCALYIPPFTLVPWNSHPFLSLFSIFSALHKPLDPYEALSSILEHLASDSWGCRCWQRWQNASGIPRPGTVLRDYFINRHTHPVW